MDEYLKAVSIHERLCEARRHHSFWSSNIVEASEGLSDPIAWQNFYSYLSNNSHEFINELLPSLGDAIDKGIPDPYANDPVSYNNETFQNGDIKIIRVKPIVQNVEVYSEDEKIECL
jgi:hypothetical protein